MKPIIITNQISKSFVLDREDKLKNLFKPKKSQQQQKELILKDINISIQKNETVGLYGPNGSGKSTLLRLLSGILKPDSGEITINGSIAPVLELGAGLHPDLSGLENIELYGSLLHTPQTHATTQKIVKMADLGAYINFPIKRYSSGMKSRLAFSIIAFSKADILLLDEVFAVGDMDFIDKSKKTLKRLKNKKTIILCSHNLQLLQGFCERIIRLENHQIVNKNKLYSVLFEIPYGNSFKSKIVSNSMYPTLKRGDTVTVQRMPISKIKNGDIVAVYFDNIQESVIHRVLAKKSKTELILQGDNNNTPDKWIANKENLLGKIVL